MTKNHQSQVFKSLANPVTDNLSPESALVDQKEPINKVCLFLAHNGNLILIVRHHVTDNSVSIEPPGGKIDPKDNGDLETPEEALARECFQEIGVLIAPDPVDLKSNEKHPYTDKWIGYYHCKHIAGTPYNKAADEHLGIIQIPLNSVKNFVDLKHVALEMGQEIVEDSRSGEELSGPIQLRISEKAFMSFFERFQYEIRSDFSNKHAENSAISPMPS